MAIGHLITNTAKAGIISSASLAGAGVLSVATHAASLPTLTSGLASVATFGEGIPILGSAVKGIAALTASLGNGLAGMAGFHAANGVSAIGVALATSPLAAGLIALGVIAVGVAAVWGISKWLNRTGDKIDHKIEENKLRAQQQSQERGQSQEQQQSRGTSPTTERIAQQQYDFGPDHPALKAKQNGKVWTQSAALPPHQQVTSPSLG